MAEWLIQVAVIAEPYFVPPRDNWASDKEDTVTIISQTSAGSPPLENVARGNGCVAAALGEIVVVGVYFSPNKPLSEFERFLVELGNMIGQCHPHPVLVLGDLNAKSLAWGSSVTDARDEELEEWVLATG
ncbi:uncharacterized protein LOC113236356, partial [Hyposmocoma kahamanoa]|uniref:uncharacterized protein LOC113236356 n=1 Tax=Hyposmocoma kahamanoa TaxID=1477025 RepID=UPI000E6DA3CD